MLPFLRQPPQDLVIDGAGRRIHDAGAYAHFRLASKKGLIPYWRPPGSSKVHSPHRMRRFTLLFLALTAGAFAEPSRPNIVFILCDDLGWGDIGSFGQKKIRTPNLDRLAKEGMKLTAHYSGHNVC